MGSSFLIRVTRISHSTQILFFTFLSPDRAAAFCYCGVSHICAMQCMMMVRGNKMINPSPPTKLTHKEQEEDPMSRDKQCLIGAKFNFLHVPRFLITF